MKERWIWWVDSSVDTEFVGWLHPDCSCSISQWQMVSLGGPYWDECSLTSSSMTREIECTLNPFPKTTNLSDAADTLEGWDAIQWDLDKLKEWAHMNIMMFNKVKCKLPHMGQSQSLISIHVGEWRDWEQPWRILELLVDERLVMSQ